MLEEDDRSRSRSSSRANTNRVENMTTWLTTVLTKTWKENHSKTQQLFNLDKNQTALQILVPDTYEDHIRTHSEESIDHLNL